MFLLYLLSILQAFYHVIMYITLYWHPIDEGHLVLPIHEMESKDYNEIILLLINCKYQINVYVDLKVCFP